MNKSAFRSLVAALALALSCLVARGQEIPPRVLLDAANLATCVKPSSQQVTVARSMQADASGVDVTIQPGKDAYPGISIKPREGDAWDLSAYGHVEAKVTNTGTAPLKLNLRVDNPHSQGASAWNGEMSTIAPGKTAFITVIFGYSYGHAPSYALKPDSIVGVLLFTGSATAPESFHIESLVAGGPPGEKPALNAHPARIKPKDGVLLGSGAAIDAAKQIGTKGGVRAAMNGQSLAITFPPSRSGDQYAQIKPAFGLWHLGDWSELDVKLKNAGSSPITPAVRVASGQDGREVVGSTLAPGEEAEVIIPFAAPAPWQGVPAAQRKANNDALPGTGTNYSSDKTDSVSFSIKSDGGGEMEVESIVGGTRIATVPDWVGHRPPVEGDWVQTFSDDFDSPTIDEKKWNVEGPNYWDKITHWSKQQLILGDGILRMRYEKKTGFQNDDPKEKQTAMACGYLDTFNKFSQRYGYFESRMKLTTAPGLWPAFWMMPDRGPNSGDTPGSKKLRCSTSNGGMEFDIMEHLDIWGPHRFNIAMHWDDYGPNHKAIGTGKNYVDADKDGFITCGLLWLPGQAVYYANGKEIARWEDARISHVPSYIMYTVPAGGWDGNALDGTGLPDDFAIDYVRVWQRRDLENNSTASAAVRTDR